MSYVFKTWSLITTALLKHPKFHTPFLLLPLHLFSECVDCDYDFDC